MYRRQLQPNIGMVPLWDLTGQFHKADRVFQSDYLRLCRAMPDDHRITALMELDFDSGIDILYKEWLHKTLMSHGASINI